MQADRNKYNSEKPTAKTTESSQKVAHGAGKSTRLPAWAAIWGDHPPAGLTSPVADLQAKHIVSQPGDRFEQEAEQVASDVMHLSAANPSMLAVPPNHPGTVPLSTTSILRVSPVPPMIQRLALEEDTTTTPTTSDDGTSSDATTTGAAPASDVSAAEPAPVAAASGETSTSFLIVDDSVDQLAPGQMKKSDFLAQLRAAVCTATEQALAGTIWSAAGCPWVDHWFSYYSSRDGQQIERAIRRYAPDTASVINASDYIPIICERVRHAIAVWSTTGEITGVPEGMEVPGGGLMGVASSIGSGIASIGSTIARGAENIASGIASVGASAASGIGSALSSIGGVFFKGREGGARATGNPQTIQSQLGAGHKLDSGVRSQMETAFGVDFSHVRVHTDTTATNLSETLNARAFTVGRDVAFGPGEYQPGTLIGDALIAHELAHVVQQGGASASTQALQKAEAPAYNALEEDADASAVGAVVSLWSGTKGIMTNIAQSAMPRLKSGLGLQRCAGARTQLRNPQDVLRESGSFAEQAAANLAQRGRTLSSQTRDQAEQQAIATAEVSTEIDVQNAIRWLEGIYRDELADAGNDVERQAQAQQRFEEQLRRLQESYMQQFEMTRRWGIEFITARTRTEFSRMPPRERYRLTVWSAEDLRAIDSILQRIPRNYLSRIQKIQREAGIESNVPAAWTDNTRTLRIYNAFFAQPEEDRLRYLIHEIGHSTDPARTVGRFASLPNEEWMRLSDWRTSTSDSLGADLGLSPAELAQALQRLNDVKRAYVGFPRPIQINNRMVVPDRYESGITSNQFLHYDAARNGEFVSDYARSHPADDLAESFAFYMLHPGETRRQLDVRHPGGGNKWNYLVQHYPQGLRPG